LGLLLIGVAGCQSPGVPEGVAGVGDRPVVVVTNTILQDLTAEIAEDKVVLVGVLEPGDDPHVYEPVPQDVQAIERADLIVYNGYNLEPALERLIQSAGRDALAAGEAAQPLAMDYDGQRVPDPHVWGDVENAIAMTEAIREALSQAFPEDAASFAAESEALIAQLRALDQWIGAAIATIPASQRQLVSTHDAFQYYAQAYGLTVLGTLIGISTEEQPSAQTVQRLAAAIRQAGIPVIFAETTLNPALIQTVATEAGVKLADRKLYSDAIGTPGSGADSYLNMLIANTTTITTALGGQLPPLPPELNPD
jgi:manganese/iron transport system substrate-binding protein